MTTATDLSGTWSVATFYRAHLDLEHLSNSKECCVRCVPALTACGVLPPGWPEAAAHRLVRRMIDVIAVPV
jgi:hypothetical protein